MKYILVITTVGNEDDAKKLAKKIIELKFGACVQIEKIKSYYSWKRKTEISDEFRLMIKTTKGKYKLLQDFIITNSKYELPEIVAIDISNGYDKYFNWIDEGVK